MACFDLIIADTRCSLMALVGYVEAYGAVIVDIVL